MVELSNMLNRIKETAKQKNITYNVLSERASMSISTLSKILSGVIKDPSISSISRIAEVLEVSLDYLVYGVDTPKKVNKSYERLNDHGKAKVDEYIKDLFYNPKYIASSGTVAEDIAQELTQESYINSHTTSTK